MRLPFLAALVTLLAISGCSSESDAPSPGETVLPGPDASNQADAVSESHQECHPGDQGACPCSAGVEGTRTCRYNGNWNICICPDVDVPEASTSDSPADVGVDVVSDVAVDTVSDAVADAGSDAVADVAAEVGDAGAGD